MNVRCARPSERVTWTAEQIEVLRVAHREHGWKRTLDMARACFGVTRRTVEAALRDFAAEKGVKLGAVAQPLRAALTGSLASPGIFEVMEVLGRDETLGRIEDAARGNNPTS